MPRHVRAGIGHGRARAGRFEVGVNATDIGTGARTAMLQLAADALDVSAELVVLHIAAGGEVTADISEEAGAEKTTSQHAYGAHFVEVHVDLDAAMIQVPRMLGVFAAGTIVNARTARSQFLGGMTMGLSMALHEEGCLMPSSVTMPTTTSRPITWLPRTPRWPAVR